MTPLPSRESFALPGLLTLAAAVLATACTAPNPDFRPLGLVVSDATAKQSADMVFDVRIDAQDVPVTVDYEAVDGTAVKGREYLETKGTLTLEPGTTTASIVVPTLLYNHVPGDVSLKLNVTVSRRTVTDTQAGTGTITPMAELARFTSISSGPYHACGVTPQRTVQCWGGGFGRTPEDVVGLTNVSTVSAGVSHTCAVIAGAVKCWGENYSGQLGNNSTTSSKVPVDVANLGGVTAVTAAGGHSCAVTTLDGKVKCWGNNSDGQLGNNSTLASPLPVEIAGLFGVTAVAAGDYHTCAVTGDGTVKCWGRNSEGQLGTGSTTASLVPANVKDRNGNNLAGVTSIAVGLQHTCALTSRGTVHCWGANREGQLGNNSTEGFLVATDVSNISGVTALTAGYDHTCAIVAQGAVKCWGHGGSLGNNSTAKALSPVDVVGLTGVTAITAGLGNTLALTPQGTVKGWGGNALGPNVTTSTEVPIDVAGFTDVTAIARDAPGFVLDESVERNRTCALTAQKTVRCTTREDMLRGVDVAGLTDVTGVAAGFGYTCAVTSQGKVQCVGRNSQGQLGNNSTTDSEVPVDVVGLDSVTSIAAGGTHTCALTAEGRVKCWGDNTSGQLGNNSTTASLAPVDTGLTGVTSIATGLAKTYAVTSDGNVKRWGLRSAFGPSGPIIDPKPVNFTELAGIASIAVGGNHACALTSQGTVKCWGQNHLGQLGNNSTIESAVPVNVAGLTGVTSITAGDYHTCAVTSQGTAMCWGDGGAYGARGSSTRIVPTEALGGQKVLGIVAGSYSTLFITRHHTVRQVGNLQSNSKVPVDTVYELK